MRVFHWRSIRSATQPPRHVPFPDEPARRRPPFRSSLLSFLSSLPFLIVLAAGLPLPLSGQWPGEVHGRVLDLVTGSPIRGAVVEIAGPAWSTRTDGSGEFRVRGIDPGTVQVSAVAIGYGPAAEIVEVRNGEVVHVALELPPAAIEVAGIRVEADRGGQVGAHRIGRDAVDASGAQTADELLEGIPGVTIRRRGVGGPATVSVRGSGEDAVLVLVDGVPLNDPVTGEADLSTVSAAAVERVTVIPGARSARFGPRAKGGVVLVETRGVDEGLRSRIRGGSLGLLGGEGAAGFRVGELGLGAALEWTERNGSFPFEHPAEAGGGDGVRRNADEARRSLRLGVEGGVAGGEVRSRLQVEELERGLPGRSFAPSPRARQQIRRGRGSAAWSREISEGTARLAVAGVLQEVGHRDPAPPFGPAYEETARLAHGSLRAEVDRMVRWSDRRIHLLAGLEADHQRVRSTGLASDAPPYRTDLGLWSGASLRGLSLPATPELRATVRLQRDALLAETVPSHDLTLVLSPGALSIHAAHRSAYSPPTLGDQFFREGVAVAPNPELGAERVRNEWELGVTGDGAVGGFSVLGHATVFRADVQGMIVWGPDFRFVWSPRNVDVNRRGVEAKAQIRHPASGLGLTGAYTLARVTYDRPDPEPVQVVYRPRHTGNVRLAWDPAPGWGGTLTARRLGTRYPVPAPLNALPGFWSLDLELRGRAILGSWTLEPSVRVDRLLDAKDSFIFAFPEPGRTWSVGLQLRRGGGRFVRTTSAADPSDAHEPQIHEEPR